MKKQKARSRSNKCRKNERGAALVMVLMISFLLITAVGALLLEASMNTANMTDATAEEQAYYAAESGIQSAVNVLRQNTVLSDAWRLDTTKPATDPANKIDYFKATRLSSSNFPGDTSTSCRLSRWMNYDTNFPDRVILGDPATYTDRNGFAYSVVVENPDNIGNVVTYSTDPVKSFIDTPGNLSKTWVNGTDTATIRYVPKASTTVDVSSGQADGIDFGSWVITYTGAGASIPVRTKFQINVNISTPYAATKVIRGFFETGTIGPATTAWILYDSQVHVIVGSTITLSPLPGCSSPSCGIYDPSPPDLLPLPDLYYRIGYRITPAVSANPGSADTKVLASITAPEPIRLVIRSTGFGPHGARKQLESFIQKNYFNGLGAPSPLTLIGPPCTPVGLCVPVIPPVDPVAPNFMFYPGTSNGTRYSGKDVLLKAFLPPIGMTNDLNVNRVHYMLTRSGANKFNGEIYGNIANVADELPFWLQSPRNLDATLQLLKATAQASGKYYGPGVTPPNSGGGRYGDPITATGITYVDGPLEFSQEGGGILIVTGQLTFKGGFTFNGLIVVTGAGGISRTGGGSGTLQGNMIVAPYNAAGISCMANNTNCFLAPRYDISGGGGSDIVYNSNNVANGLGALTNFVKGVAEK